MAMNMQTALQLAKDPDADAQAYREALEYLVDHRDELTHRIYICLPGGLVGNQDSVWEKVKSGSEERCSCGNERVIMPASLRTEFESGNQQVVVAAGAPVYIRPAGGDLESCYMQLDVEEGALTFLTEPFAPLVLTMDIFSRKGYPLEQLAEVVDKRPTMLEGKHKTPLFQIVAVDALAGTVTIELDKDVEAFDPDKEKKRHDETSATA